MTIINPALTLRPETEQDSVFLERLFRSTRDDLMQLGLPEAVIDNLINMQFRAQQSSYRTQFPDADYGVVETEGEPIGYLITNHGSQEIRLVYIALSVHERNKGHGRRLIQTLQAKAAGENKPLTLSVDPRNMPAKHLYFDLGFQVRSDDGVNLELIWLGDTRNPPFTQEETLR